MIQVFSCGNSGGSDCGFGVGGSFGNITGGHKIGKNVIIGAGSVVTKNIPDNCLAYGNPHKIVKRKRK